MIIWRDRVYLDMPEMKEYKVSLTEEIRKDLREKLLNELEKMTVFAVGVDVKNVKPGDEVFVDPIGLRRGRVIMIEGKEKISVQEDEIMHTW